MEYPPSKPRVVLCDDGYYKSKGLDAVARGERHWATPALNAPNLARAGDLRAAVAAHVDALECAATAAIYGATSDAERAAATAAAVGIERTTRDAMPDPCSSARAVARVDCAHGFSMDDYRGLPNTPRITYIARLKPTEHHAKAGNEQHSPPHRHTKVTSWWLRRQVLMPHVISTTGRPAT